MNNIKYLISCTLVLLVLSGCSAQQIGQAVYDGVKGTKCTEQTGNSFCNPPKNSNAI